MKCVKIIMAALIGLTLLCGQCAFAVTQGRSGGDLQGLLDAVRDSGETFSMSLGEGLANSIAVSGEGVTIVLHSREVPQAAQMLLNMLQNLTGMDVAMADGTVYSMDASAQVRLNDGRAVITAKLTPDSLPAVEGLCASASTVESVTFRLADGEWALSSKFVNNSLTLLAGEDTDFLSLARDMLSALREGLAANQGA